MRPQQSSSTIQETVETTSSIDSSLPPPGLTDRYRLVYLIFFFVGVGTLVPWNFFATAKEYFSYKLRNTSLPDGSDYEDRSVLMPMQIMYENAVALCSMIPITVSTCIHLVLQKRLSIYVRFVGGLSVLLIMFVVTLVMIFVNTDDCQDLFFYITMLSVVFMNCGGAFIQGSLFGMAALFPPAYMRAAMEGQAVAGILAAVANIITLSAANNPRVSATAYFSLALAIIFISGGMFLSLSRLSFSRYYMEKMIPVRSRRGFRHSHLHEEDDEDVGEASSPSSTTATVAGEENDWAFEHGDRTSSRRMLVSPASIRGHSGTVDEVTPFLSPAPSSKGSLRDVIRSLAPVALAVYLVFVVSLALFPAVLARIESMWKGDEKNIWANRYFTPVVCFLFFNVSDYVGRFLAGVLKWPASTRPRLLLLCSVLRVVFIPIGMLCNVQPRYLMPVWFLNDTFPILLVLALGFSNGYFATLAMMYASSYVQPKDAETAGAAMSVFLSLGLASGVALSFGLVFLI